MLEGIKKDFEWGKKTSERGHLNLDDEQVEWLIKQAEKGDVAKAIQDIEKEAKAAHQYALACRSNSVQEHWFGQSQAFNKAIVIIQRETSK